MIEIYNQQKASLLALAKAIDLYLEENSELLSKHNLTEFKKGREELSKTTEALLTSAFIVSVIGELKKGKSSLLNVLLGEDICPVGVTEKTATLSILKYGEEPGLRVQLGKKKYKSAVLNELPEYVTKKGSQVKKTISVEITLNNHFLREGIYLVDTPGVNTPNKAMQKKTEEWLNKTDAAIIVLDTNGLISRSEKDFIIERVFNDNSIKSIFVVINKADDPSNPDTIQQINFTTEKVRYFVDEALGETNFEIIPISAKKAREAVSRRNEELLLKSGLPVLQNKLSSYLINEVGRAHLFRHTSVIKHYAIENILKGINNYLLLLNKSKQELNDYIVQLQKEKDSLESKQKADEALLKNAKIIAENEGNIFIDKKKNELKSFITSKFSLLPTQGTLDKLTEELSNKITKAFAEYKSSIINVFSTKSDIILKNSLNSLIPVETGMGITEVDISLFLSSIKSGIKTTGFWRGIWGAIKEFFGFDSTVQDIANNQNMALQSVERILNYFIKDSSRYLDDWFAKCIQELAALKATKLIEASEKLYSVMQEKAKVSLDIYSIERELLPIQLTLKEFSNKLSFIETRINNLSKANDSK